MPSGQSRVRPIYVSLLSGALALVLGIAGYISYGLAPVDAAYTTLGGFALNYPLGLEANALIHASRLSALLAAGSAIFAAVHERVRAYQQRTAIRLQREHILIIGADAYGTALARTWHEEWEHSRSFRARRHKVRRYGKQPDKACKACHHHHWPDATVESERGTDARGGAGSTSRSSERSRRIVVIERDESRPEVAELRAAGVLVLIGDAKDKKTLARAAAARARWVFVFIDRFDAAQEVVDALSEEGRDRAETSQRIVLHVHDPQLAQLARLRYWRREANLHGFRIDVASVPENVAQHVVDARAPTASAPILLGDGLYLTAILAELRSKAAGSLLQRRSGDCHASVDVASTRPEAAGHDNEAITSSSTATAPDMDDPWSSDARPILEVRRRDLHGISPTDDARDHLNDASREDALFVDGTDRGLALALAAEALYPDLRLIVLRDTKREMADAAGDETAAATTLESTSIFRTGLTKVGANGVVNIKNTLYTRLATLVSNLGSGNLEDQPTSAAFGCRRCLVCTEALMLLVESMSSVLAELDLAIAPIEASTSRRDLLTGQELLTGVPPATLREKWHDALRPSPGGKDTATGYFKRRISSTATRESLDRQGPTEEELRARLTLLLGEDGNRLETLQDQIPWLLAEVGLFLQHK